jgi:hypothetical protein
MVWYLVKTRDNFLNFLHTTALDTANLLNTSLCIDVQIDE